MLQSSDGWLPVQHQGGGAASGCLAVMSIAFMLSHRDEAVVWRGPKKNAMVKQLLGDVRWGSLDILLIDTPPGTSDEQISTIEHLRSFGAHLAGAVLVTTPQAVSVVDVRKEINFCQKLNVPILGIVENMSGFVCPCCEEVTDIFSKGGGEKLASEYQVVPTPADPESLLALTRPHMLAAHADSSQQTLHIQLRR